MDAFRALPANDDGSVAVANAADTALLEHGKCGGFSWLCTAAGQAFRNALVGHGAKGGFADTAWRWLLFGTDADRPPGQAAGRGDRAQGWFATLFANMRPSRIAGAMWVLDVDAGTHALSTDAGAAWPVRGAQLAPRAQRVWRQHASNHARFCYPVVVLKPAHEAHSSSCCCCVSM